MSAEIASLIEGYWRKKRLNGASEDQKCLSSVSLSLSPTPLVLLLLEQKGIPRGILYAVRTAKGE